MYYDDQPPPHIHAEYQGNKAKIDFGWNVLLDDLRSKRALAGEEWIGLHDSELKPDWELQARLSRPGNDAPTAKSGPRGFLSCNNW